MAEYYVTMLSVFDILWTNKTVATVCVGLVALFGDYVVTHYTQSGVVQAVADNLTHGTIGLLTWHIVTTHLAGLSFMTQLSEILLCGLLASAIDLDHFAAARSFRIEDARQLPSRPPLHCTSVMLAVSGILLLLSFTFRWLLLHRLSWILIAAFLSHHLRDATRRGLWMYPYGSSPPIPYAGYIVGCMLLPHVLPSLVRGTQPAPQHATLHSVVVIVLFALMLPLFRQAVPELLSEALWMLQHNAQVMKCFQSYKMADSKRIFSDDSELEIFSLVTGCFSVLALVILAISVIHLNSSIKKLKKQVALQTRKDLHSFQNPTIQPDEELGKRGFSMYKGQQDVRAPNTPEKEEYFGNFGDFSPQPHKMARRY